ncbi:MAG: 2-isopropylmalate synthase, partial [Pseudomonadota bacterium]
MQSPWLIAGIVAASLAGAASAQSTAVKQYDDGGVYEGEFRNGVQHGQGTYRLPSGYEYTGEWVDGEIRGQGTARFPNGSVYVG